MDVEEIKARLQVADKENFWEDVNSNLVFEDIPALIAEIETLQAERNQARLDCAVAEANHMRTLERFLEAQERIIEVTAERDALLKSFKVKPVGLEERGD